MNIQTMLDELAAAREAYMKSITAMNAMLSKVRENPQFTAHENSAAQAKEEIAALEERVRAWGLAAYTVKKGERHPHPGVEIKIFKTVRIAQPDNVKVWAMKRLPDAVILDEKIISAYVLKVAPIPGVKVQDEPKVFISSKLGISKG